ARQDRAHLPPIVSSRHLEMPDLYRDARFAADGERLLDGIHLGIRLAANMRGINTAVARSDLGQGDELCCLSVGARWVDKRAGNAPRTLFHGCIDQLLHSGELLGVGLNVLEAQHGNPYLCGANERAEVDGAARGLKTRGVSTEVRPIDLQLKAAEERLHLRQGRVADRRHRFTLAGDLRCNSLTNLRLHAAIDEDVELGLAEQVDEAGRHYPIA